MTVIRLQHPLPQSQHEDAKIVGDEAALLALAADAQDIAKTEATIDALVESGALSEATAHIMQRCFIREAQSVLEQATDLDADTPTGLHAKGMIARHLLWPALQGNSSTFEEGERFLHSIILDIIGPQD